MSRWSRCSGRGTTSSALKTNKGRAQWRATQNHSPARRTWRVGLLVGTNRTRPVAGSLGRRSLSLAKCGRIFPRASSTDAADTESQTSLAPNCLGKAIRVSISRNWRDIVHRGVGFYSALFLLAVVDSGATRLRADRARLDGKAPRASFRACGSGRHFFTRGRHRIDRWLVETCGLRALGDHDCTRRSFDPVRASYPRKVAQKTCITVTDVVCARVGLTRCLVFLPKWLSSNSRKRRNGCSSASRLNHLRTRKTKSSNREATRLQRNRVRRADGGCRCPWKREQLTVCGPLSIRMIRFASDVSDACRNERQ